MKFTCAKNKLQEAISIAQKAVTGKSPMPILQGIHICAKNNGLTLIGSDIDLSIETKIEAEVEEEGSIVVDSKLFGEIIRKLPNSSIHINTTENNSIEIICEKSKFDLIHMDAEEFPNLPSINENIIFSIPEKVLKNMIKGTIFAIAQDETRPILTGILFEVRDKRLNLVALDGYRLALRSNMIDNENTISAVIPGKTFNEVSKILSEDEKNVNITFTPNHILFNLGETKIISRLLEGEFIKYNSIIPEEYKLKVNAKRAELLNCIERASLMGKDGNTNLVKFDIKNDNLVITSNSQLGRVREELNIILQGDELQIAFNSKYLIDVLKILEDDEIVMEFDSSVSPCVIKSKENNTYTYLVLPVRLLNA
ncbi:DNA polymerase III subunit beta [Clostridium botulinum]|uniref:Beta sliding clamp n=1 Tax=Clostridium botulinum C/D str. DC5 TaxID=1443128 RepID=A0A0A0IAT5_CLOBO|nr:DNA polymerase III subunit beta [Clostridium botulinum]KGM98145.1 DNA polymerase III subunit beta [Clostridium botulinum D str. CCUG 7971]KGM98564.1 DNA polymerase III subunit beta [Clostridium botulinum C/D str. DC5]KOC50356.1 DNA polymerase III subunit beta [Clostridium botulinum]KOC54625.1 DNA polymerase III subunit beta [Clostridium botulinum]KOC54913.1 DNA polymerase III subunit beta [Clostridium botulinum]